MFRLRTFGASIVVLAVASAAWGQSWSGTDSKSLPPPGAPRTVEIKPINTFTCNLRWGSADISPDGRTIVFAGGGDNFVWLRSLATGKQVDTFIVAPGENTGLALFSPDGKTLACTCGDGCTVHLLATASGKVIKRIGPFPAAASLVRFTPDGKNLVAICDDNCLRIWDAASGDEKMTLRLCKHGRELNGTALSWDCSRVAFQIEENTLVFDVNSGKEVFRFEWSEDDNYTPARQFVFSPDGKFLAVPARAASAIRVWDLTNSTLARDFTWDHDPADRTHAAARNLTFSPDSKSLFAACGDGKLRVWEIATGGLRYQTAEKAALCLGVPHTNQMVTANYIEGPNYAKGTFQVWDRGNPTCKQAATIHDEHGDELWADLGSPDSSRSFDAISSLVVARDDAVKLIGRRLKVIEPAGDVKIDRLIAELDSNEFATREAASRQLEKLGPRAKAKLEAEQTKGTSKEAAQRVEALLDLIKNPGGTEWRRMLRAVEVLEAIRTPAAQRLLQDLSRGAPGAVLTEEARGAYSRMKQE
jgi:WD40 repeat protein